MDAHLTDGRIKRFVVGGALSGYCIASATFKSDDLRKLLEMDDETLRFWLESLGRRLEPQEADHGCSSE